MTSPTGISIPLPAWASALLLAELNTPFSSPEMRMQLAIRIARFNIEQGTGGPFGAAIFDLQTNKLVAIGMNLVVASHCSMAHAEMMAISMAQQQQQHFDLGKSAQQYELATSCEPCAMCFGAMPWSGIRHLSCAARDADARAIGFDEGPKFPDWQKKLTERNIRITTDLCRNDAVDVLQQYAINHGTIYNG